MRRTFSMLGALALVVTSVLAMPGPAAAAERDLAGQVVAGLRTDPVYVHPSMRDPFTEEQHAQLREDIEGAEPLFVFVVPLSYDDDYAGSAAELSAVVADRLGVSATFVHAPTSAFDKSWGYTDTDIMSDMSTALRVAEDQGLTGGAQAVQAVHLTVTGTANDAYEALPDESSSEGAGATWWVIGALGAAAVLLTTYARRRKRARTAGAGQGTSVPALKMSSQAVRNVYAARADKLNRQAHTAVLELGERIDETDIRPGNIKNDPHLQAALDRYAAARKVMDGAQQEADYVGALLLARQGSSELEVALGKKGAEPPARPCFFNPWHGAATETRDAKVGTRRISVPCCKTCAAALRRKRSPDALYVVFDGRDQPYYEDDDSVWGSTGFGSLRDDLVDRVMRGEG